MPYDAWQGGEQGKAVACRMFVRVGCPRAGLGVVGGKGLASPCPLPPAAQATTLACRAEAVRPWSDKKRKQPLTPCRISAVDARKAPSPPDGHGPAGRHSVARRAGDHARMPGRSRQTPER